MPAKNFDQKAVIMGYCCGHAAIRILTRPEDSITKIAKMFDVCLATVKNQRKKFRAGELPCARRATCLRAIWLTRRQIDKEEADAERAKEKEAKRAAKES